MPNKPVGKQEAIPEFADETQEAEWWDNNPEFFLQQFQRAAEAGTLKRRSVARAGSIPTTTIRLDPADIELARTLAKQVGMRYQTFLKAIIHEALTARRLPSETR